MRPRTWIRCTPNASSGSTASIARRRPRSHAGPCQWPPCPDAAGTAAGDARLEVEADRPPSPLLQQVAVAQLARAAVAAEEEDTARDVGGRRGVVARGRGARRAACVQVLPAAADPCPGVAA